jgi:protein-arginine kinase activator protein McsA
MICNICKTREAAVHLVQDVGGETRKVDLCEACYREIPELQDAGDWDDERNQQPPKSSKGANKGKKEPSKVTRAKFKKSK